MDESDAWQFASDLTVPLHECTDTGNVDLDDETPLRIIKITNRIRGHDTFNWGSEISAFRDHHDDDLLRQYDVPVVHAAEMESNDISDG